MFYSFCRWIAKLPVRLLHLFWRELKANIGIIVGYGCVGTLGLALTVFMLMPAYKDPNSRMYTSGMGFGAVKRKFGMPFDVSATRVVRRDIVIPYLGEGLITGNPVRVAMIPIAIVKKVHVKEGDYVTAGQLLLELDDLEARRKLASAELALRTAEAELKRVEIGSTYALAQERPAHDRLKVGEAESQVNLLEQKVDAQRNMLKRGLIAKIDMVDSERQLEEARRIRDEAKLFAGMSQGGHEQSRHIASNALIDAQQAVEFRKAELLNYKLYAHSDGLVNAVLIREGEFNSDTGKPAFLVTQGKWFEGYFDQAVLSRLKIGQDADVFLEAFPGERFKSKVTKIIPEVTFASGGPEIARPLRPRGTGAPEWAATFRVQFEFETEQESSLGVRDLAIGMTGNVKVLTQTNALVVPRNAVHSVAASRAMVTKPNELELKVASKNWTMLPVKLGYVGFDWVEIAEGINEGDVVLNKGHRIIREGDAIQLVELDE